MRPCSTGSKKLYGCTGSSARDLIEPLAEFGGNVKRERREVVLKLRDLGSAENRGRHSGLRRDPVQRDLRGGLAEFLAPRRSACPTIFQLRSVNLLKMGFPLMSRPSPVPPSLPLRLYLPLRNPPASGLQGQMPMPSYCVTGTCSRSMLRSMSEYSSCRVAMRSLPSFSASVCARATYHAGVSEKP